jgi:hypothetical protein
MSEARNLASEKGEWKRGATGGKAETGNDRKAPPDTSGGWRRNGRKVAWMSRGRPVGDRTAFMPAEGRRTGPAGVRASVVAVKRGNARGAKGRRKVET